MGETRRTPILGNGEGGLVAILAGAPVFDDPDETSGTLQTEAGDVAFAAEDCGAVDEAQLR